MKNNVAISAEAEVQFMKRLLDSRLGNCSCGVLLSYVHIAMRLDDEKTYVVIPAKAGIQTIKDCLIPALAGITEQ